MLKRLTTGLTNPPQLVLFMKDSWTRVLIYLLVLPLILVVPTAIRFLIQPGMSVDQFQQWETVLERDFNLEGASIIDGVFSTDIKETVHIDYFQITTTKEVLNVYSMSFVFESESLVIYLGNMAYKHLSYEALGINNFTFDLTDPSHLNTLTNALKALYETQQLTMYASLVAVYIIGLFDFVMTVLLLSFIDYYILPMQPFSFKTRFKLSVYASTIYIFLMLTFTLFNIVQWQVISIVLTYFYHIWMYRSMHIISKGVNINGTK